MTASHDGHERAFGPDWRRASVPAPSAGCSQHRWSMRLPRVPAPGWTRDVPFSTIPGTDRQLLADIWEPAAGVERTGTAIVYLYGGSWHFFDKDVLTRPSFASSRRRATSSWMPPTGAARDGCVRHGGRRASRGGLDQGECRALRDRSRSGGRDGWVVGRPHRVLAAYAPHEPRLVPEELHGADTSVMAVVSWYGIPEMASAVERWSGQEAAVSSPPVWDRKDPARLPTSSTSW